MSKMSKAIAVLGVVAGLGVAAMPLSSYAATSSEVKAETRVQVEVGGAISIAAASDGTDKAIVDLGQLKINGATDVAGVTVTVSSNSAVGYDLTIKSKGAETALVNANGAKIPALTDGGQIKGGTSAWGYGLYTKTTVDNDTAPTTFKGISATPENIASYTPTEGDSATNRAVKVGFKASASSSQDEGQYTGTVVFTATAK